jgi:CheY-like chemotaxis protein/AraC-like DNA-binding protein
MDLPHQDSRRQMVLVVDDDRGARDALELILEETYDVSFAHDGPSALRVLSDQGTDAVMLDLGLPEMDGFEVLSRICSIAPRVPVIIVTVRNTAADAARALKMGACDYLTKPFDEELVLTTLAQALAVSPPVSPRTDGRRKGSGTAARCPPVVAYNYLRPRCLVVAQHIGTAGTLRLILDRYVPTNVAADCLHAVRLLGVGLPNCVVIDHPAWEAEGSTLIRILRAHATTVRVGVITATAPAPPYADVVLLDRLDHVVSYVLLTCGLAGSGVAGRRLSDRVLAALDYLRVHYAETVSADGIANAAATSRSSLAERFRIELGMSVSHFLMTLRVEIAKLLLAERPAKLEQVAALAGFRDPSHLSRVFRAETGYRPGAYRRQFEST